MRPMASSLPAVAVVVSRYNAGVTDKLREGALHAYELRGGDRGAVAVFEAPGSFELTGIAAEAARTGRFAGVVILGCVIKGETRHDDYINHAVAQGITMATVQTGVPIAFGLVTTENAGQARERAGGIHGNKGEESMSALLDTIATLHAVRTGATGGGSGGGVGGVGVVKDKTAVKAVKKKTNSKGGRS